MRIQDNPHLPQDLPALVRQLSALHVQVAAQLNGLSEGRVVNAITAGTAAPTAGTWAVGDFVRNSAPAEAGSASSKYVVIGWTCTVAGSPGTWLACRCLTGN